MGFEPITVVVLGQVLEESKQLWGEVCLTHEANLPAGNDT
jgi:hypothetical protein